MLVTRWQRFVEDNKVFFVVDNLVLFRHWFYGEKMPDGGMKVVLKGWFPSKCVELHEDERAKFKDESEVEEDDDEKKKQN